MSSERMILAADIGGTSSRFAAFRAAAGAPLVRISSKWLKTGDYQSFEALVDALGKSDFPLRPEKADAAVIAVAGPVREARYSAPPNISWDISLESPSLKLPSGKAFLVNDFTAQAYATRSPVAAAAEQLLPGEEEAGGAVAVVGAGTGLGHAALVPDGYGGQVAVPAEKGHAAFPMVNSGEQEFQAYLCRELGEPYARGDAVVSGRGFAMLHRFLTGTEITPEELTACWSEGSPGETLVWASRFYARACRDYALTVLSTGGLYIAGGLAARTPILVRHQTFADEFRSSPTMGELLGRIPVFLQADEESGLWGAAQYGLQVLGESNLPFTG